MPACTCTALHCTAQVGLQHRTATLKSLCIALLSLLQLDRCNDEAMEALHTAWPVLLGQMAGTKPHSNLTQRLVCTLSQVSQGMRSTVLAQAASHLSVDLMSWREPRKMRNSFARCAVCIDSAQTWFLLGGWVQSATGLAGLFSTLNKRWMLDGPILYC